MANAKFCQLCGTAAGDGSFCRACGNQLKVDETAKTAGATSSVGESVAEAAAQASEAGTATSLQTKPEGPTKNGKAQGEAAKPQSKSDSRTGDGEERAGAKRNGEPSAVKSSGAKINGKPSKSEGSKSEKKREERSDKKSATEGDGESPAEAPQLAYLDPNAGKTNWAPIAIVGGVVVTLCAVVAVILLLAGGKPASKANNPQAQSSVLSATYLASRALYFQAPQPNYSVLLPAGWQTIKTTDSQLTNAIAVQSPLDSTATITVGQVTTPASSLTREEHNLHSRAEKATGYSQVGVGTVNLAGHRPAWQLTYTTNAGTNVLAVVPSCGNDYVIEAGFPTNLASTIAGRVAVVGNTLEGIC